ncbi:mechanosensitive ion channel family protein [Marinobacterium sediminicola]|uniref:Small-conductance mechanosensitive channel n=1 Tax=Marinobacterium sediminicola TaxID=518898 RepID=A0ABY1RWG0_9GAMM|nr:mechanosensitive ion channel family protein [Marinobacterium sediminicola]ULG70321.1 mechanosensitive ion channel family protein [Marinobacterium sediminicola]SMR69727.1 small conductance mechanosensitive channel [Marinobacterium sediminicola]
MEESVKQELVQFQEIYNLVVEFFVNYSFQIVGALIIVLLGLWVAGKVSSWALALMERHNLDVTLSRFIASCVRILIVAMVAIVALGKLGISVTPLIAMIGAVGLGAGLAIQGLLSNYSAGLTIVLTRPYVVGDTIRVQGVSGLVKEVHLSHTLLTNEDGVEISIPNKHVVGEIIHNSHANTLAEVSIDIAYSADPEHASALLKKALQTFGDQICQEPAPQVGIEAFGESGITLGVRVWLPTERYYDLLYSINLALFNALKDAGIEIPFPQREVRLLNTPTAA